MNEEYTEKEETYGQPMNYPMLLLRQIEHVRFVMSNCYNQSGLTTVNSSIQTLETMSRTHLPKDYWEQKKALDRYTKGMWKRLTYWSEWFGIILDCLDKKNLLMPKGVEWEW